MNILYNEYIITITEYKLCNYIITITEHNI